VLVAIELLYWAVEQNLVNLSLYITTFNTCGTGRLILLPQDNMSLLSQIASKYSKYYMLCSVLFYMFCSLKYKYSIETYLLIILDILFIFYIC
jgi:hypothetical protein